MDTDKYLLTSLLLGWFRWSDSDLEKYGDHTPGAYAALEAVEYVENWERADIPSIFD